MATKPAAGAAAAADTGASSADDQGHALMAAVAKRAGVKAPVQEKPADTGAGEGGEGGDNGDTDESRRAAAAAAAGENGGAEGGEGGDGNGEGNDAGAGDGAGGEGEGGDAGDGEDADTKQHAAETAKFVDLKLKDLPEETRKRVQDVINARLGKMHATAKADKAQLETRVEELEGELADAKSGVAPVNVPGVHPLMLAQSEAELDRRLTEIDQAEDFAIRYADGYPGTEGNPNDPPIEPADIKLRWRELQRERDRVIPAARRALQERGTHDAALRKLAPAFFDRKSEDYRAAQAKLKLMPELRRHADANGIAVQLILGERALAAMKTGAANPPKPGALPKKAPRLPGSGSSANGNGAASNRGTSTMPAAMKQLGEATNTRGVTRAVEMMLKGG